MPIGNGGVRLSAMRLAARPGVGERSRCSSGGRRTEEALCNMSRHHRVTKPIRTFPR